MALRKHDVHDNDQHSAKRTRVTFDVSPQLRRRIKMAADQRDISVGEYLSRILDDVVPEEAHLTQEMRPITHRTLDSFLQMQNELIQERGNVPFSDSLEIIHTMREERSKELEEL